MGAPLTIYNLYQLVGGNEKLLLVRAERPEFPNWSQPAENAAIDAVDSEFIATVAARQSALRFSEAKLIGTWEDAYPQGDIFYSDQSDIPVEVWFALETKYQRYFVFGIADSENAFWDALSELHSEGDLWGFGEFARPALRQRVWLVQSRAT
jgi:hypothetical protein